MPVSRRRWLIAVFGVGGLTALPVLQAALITDAPTTITMVARRFQFEPGEIIAKAGVPIVLEVRSLDFVHGMNFPDFGLRVDLVPGRVIRVELPAQNAGTYDFLCDNFCGDGHEVMHGRLVVKD